MGRYLTDLADVLRAAGLTVVEVPGWQTRGARVRYSTPDGGLRSVTGILVHHTGTSAKAPGDYPTLPVILQGRPDVAGPLAQLGLGRSGTWYVCAAGRANHSGAVDDPRYSNPNALGVEAEHPGGTAPWPPAQLRSYVIGVAALQRAYGTAEPRGHKEAAVPYGRKPDPTFDMATFRRDVAATNTNREDDPMPEFTQAHANAIEATRAKVEWLADVMGHGEPATPLWHLRNRLDTAVVPRLVELVGREDDQDQADVDAIVAKVLVGLDPATLANAIANHLARPHAEAVADVLAERLGQGGAA